MGAVHCSTCTISVLIVDDHRLFADALRAALDDEPDLTVAGVIACAADVDEAVRRLAPDVVLIDCNLSPGDGIELAAELRRDHRNIRCVALSGDRSDELIARAADACAGFLCKTDPIDYMVDMIHRVHDGNAVFAS